MNKTLTINLGGINFYIDDDAYAQLEQYLSAVSNSLEPESREETLRDIEARIAELFLEQSKDQSNVVNQQMIQHVIEIMGQPEDYQVDADEDKKEREPQHEKEKKKIHKKLYRDIDNRVVAGVCSGLGHYFGVDRVWIRVIFIVLFLPLFTSKILLPSGSTILLIYIILWVAVPSAKTTTEKLEMQGEKIDIDNIERKVKEEYQNLKNKIGKKDYSGLEGFLERLGNVLLALLKGIAIFIGVLIVLVAGTSLIAIVVSMFSMGAISFFGLDPMTEMTSAFPILPSWLVYVSVSIISGIPMLLLLFAGLKIINPRSKIISLTGILIILGIWVLSLIPFIISASVHFPSEWDRDTPPAPTTQTEQIQETPLTITDTLIVTRLHSIGSAEGESRPIVLHIKPTRTTNKLEINRILKSSKREIRARNSAFQFTFKEDTLRLNDFFSILKNTKDVYDQDVEATLYLNDTTPFKVDKNLKDILEDFSETYSNEVLQFENGAIQCQTCEHQPESSSESDSSDEWYQDPVNS